MTMTAAQKYGGEQCCVCGKYGAHEPFGEPLRALVAFAIQNRLTLRKPNNNAVHPKCLQKLKTLMNWRAARDRTTQASGGGTDDERGLRDIPPL